MERQRRKMLLREGTWRKRSRLRGKESVKAKIKRRGKKIKVKKLVYY